MQPVSARERSRARQASVPPAQREDRVLSGDINPGTAVSLPAPASFVHKCDPSPRGWDDRSSHHHREGMNSTDIASLRAFYLDSRQQLYTYAVSITGNREAAEDAIHGVFEKLLRRGKWPADLRPYVFRSVRNAAFDAWRRTRVRLDSIFEAAAEAEANGPAAPEARAPDDLEPLLHRLSPDERETIVLKVYGGLTFQEIAALRRVPPPTAASWYRRGLERLRVMLKEEH